MIRSAQIKLGDKTLKIFTEDGVIYAEIDGGTKHTISTHVKALSLDRKHCDEGQVRIVWANEVETFLDIRGDEITVL